VRAQQRRLGLAPVEVQRVEAAAGRVRGRHVERLEVVPVRLDLGSFGDGEAHPEEGVLERVARLGDKRQRAPQQARSDLGEVQPLGVEARRARGRLQVGGPAVERRRQTRPGLVDQRTRLLALGRVEGPDGGVEGGQLAALAQDLGLGEAQLVHRGGGGQSLVGPGFDVADGRGVEGHGASGPRSPGRSGSLTVGCRSSKE